MEFEPVLRKKWPAYLEELKGKSVCVYMCACRVAAFYTELQNYKADSVAACQV